MLPVPTWSGGGRSSCSATRSSQLGIANPLQSRVVGVEATEVVGGAVAAGQVAEVVAAVVVGGDKSALLLLLDCGYQEQTRLQATFVEKYYLTCSEKDYRTLLL